MITAFYNFLWMGGYGSYVWSAYLVTFIALALQWYIPWRRWKKYSHKIHSEKKQIPSKSIYENE